MIPKICLFALLCTMMSALLDSMGFKSRGLFATLCAIMLLSVLADGLSDVTDGIMRLAAMSGITDAASCALRIIGLGYVFGFTSEICASVGEGLISSVVTAAGRVHIFLVAYPYFEDIARLGAELLK